ncbi:MAG: AAA family ATPase [Sulfurovum sp.]
MITKIEIHGFKSFNNFEMEFTPLTVVAGTNASGKSNLFDALHLLQKLTETDLRTAFSGERGEPLELFTQYKENNYAKIISINVEMLVDNYISDNWGVDATLKYTRLRYELSIERRKNKLDLDELHVIHEELRNIKHDDDDWVRNFIPNQNKYTWRPKVSVGRRGKPYIQTIKDGNTISFKIPQDGKAGGKSTPGNAVSQTILSSINSVDFPHAFAAKEEIRKWKFLQLNPEALRQPSKYLSESSLSPEGDNLAATLFRIKQDNEFNIKLISRKLNNLLPNIVEVDVLDDKPNQQYLVKVKSEEEGEYTSRVLSEGTLRLLVLCVLLYDDTFKGLLCFEEPENGIHPSRINTMVELLNDLSIDFYDPESPLRQVIINTHSPTLVSNTIKLQNSKKVSIWFSRLVSKKITSQNKPKMIKVTKMLPVIPNQQKNLFKSSKEEQRLTLTEVKKYLEDFTTDEYL